MIPNNSPVYLASVFLDLFFWLTRLELNLALRKLPGPAIARLTSFYRVFLVLSGNGPSKIQNLHNKYGPIVRTGPNHVLVADPAMLSVIYPAGPSFIKGPLYEVFHLFYHGTRIETLVSTRDPSHHKRLRSAVTSKLLPSSIQFLEPLLDDCIKMFTQSMYDTHGQPLNLAEWLEYFAYDAASAMVLGTRFGFMEKHGDINGTLSQLKQGFRYATIIGQVPEWHPWLLGNRILATFLQKHTSFPDPTVEILQMVTERLQAWNEEQHAQQNNILTWLQVGQKTANKLSQTDIVNNLFTYVAGSAAISTSLGAVFYYLLKHPSAYCKLVKEIQGRDKSGYISSYITSSQSKEMPYLQAVLKEAMRLAPSVALPLDRCVPPAGATICGHYLPGGTNVSMCAAVVHQDTTIYGDDAAAFSPERWLNATPDAKRAMELHFFAFGKGGRACVGKDLAMLQMEKFLMEILERFDVEWAAEEKDWKVKNFWLPEYYGLLVRLKARVT